MFFTVLPVGTIPTTNYRSKAFLIMDNWNDWNYITQYWLVYYDKFAIKHDLGAVKIGHYGQSIRQRLLKSGDTFDYLDNRFFSLGQDDSYYEKLNKLGSEVRDNILIGLNDIAKNPEIFSKAIDEEVTKTSLTRSISFNTITGQYRRMANGGARLTDFEFEFHTKSENIYINDLELTFQVSTESFPPTNIHVVIGRNGVGKSYLINNMINCLVNKEDDILKNGQFVLKEGTTQSFFSNLISVSFSAFDKFGIPEIKSESSIPYKYIGLKRNGSDKTNNFEPKNLVMLNNDFVLSISEIIANNKTNRWKKALEILESDTNFQRTNISSLSNIRGTEFNDFANSVFNEMSSGHKIVLLTITRLVETLEEKSLVLIDEPEAHLHPPLLSAFIRALSDLLIDRNGVCIIATHSPVILQEVPKSCVWKLRRQGETQLADRLEIESFGENVGILTHAVFGLEVTNSGFYKILEDVVDKYDKYEDIITYFKGQLGMEARSIIMTLLANKNDL